MQEVGGSIPPGSTTINDLRDGQNKEAWKNGYFLYHLTGGA